MSLAVSKLKGIETVQPETGVEHPPSTTRCQDPHPIGGGGVGADGGGGFGGGGGFDGGGGFEGGGVQDEPPISAIALPTFSRPSVTHLPVRAAMVSTEFIIAHFTCDPVALGFAACRRAAAPATWGVAMDVPLNVA